jgi:solute carrier family 25 carnitine/acylcarnitine transporter 20/29
MSTTTTQNNEEVLAPAKQLASSQGLAQIRSFVAGGVGGICAVVIGHPFDLVKVRMQTAEKGVYTGAIDVVKKTIAREGLARGLYAGVSAPLVGVTPMCKPLHPLILDNCRKCTDKVKKKKKSP